MDAMLTLPGVIEIHIRKFKVIEDEDTGYISTPTSVVTGVYRLVITDGSPYYVWQDWK